MDVLLHAHLLLASNVEALEGFNVSEPGLNYARNILSGDSYLVVENLFEQTGKKIEVENPSSEDSTLHAISQFISENFQSNFSASLLLAIALLQCFIQNNFTGPSTPTDLFNIMFQTSERELVNEALLQSLAVSGQPAYELMDNPECIVLALILLEKITNQPSLFDVLRNGEEVAIPEISGTETSGLLSSAHWWRQRAISLHLSLLPEPSGHQPIVASAIMSSIDICHSITKDLPADVTDAFKKNLYTIYYLENVKVSLAINTEHLCLSIFNKSEKLTDFQFVLTGARAKRTKFQQTGHAGLIILAQSNTHDEKDAVSSITPESFELNSELLLERPHFDSIGSEPLDEQIVKKQKFENNGLEDERLLPLAIRQESIPEVLKSLDPNDQPLLSNYDSIQLLLRLYTIRQTSPAKDPLVEEELSALISRIVYQDGPKNWTIFSRSLWERSILETNKAKTIERGLLQMQSLVEELGLKIQTRLVPQNEDDISQSPVPRLKYIHQLPFIPRWNLDSQLAEKYMSLGLLRSAVEIYDRLHMCCESALCYAAVGDEKNAEEILVARIEENPKDARAYSILGNIRQDPSLWEKSWEIGKYVNAKNSLGRYYYNPPANSGITRDYSVALKHLNDSLRQYPLSFETWYFYGCVALECGKMEVASEAFSRCVSLDESHPMSWSNLSAAYVELGKLKEAHSCLKRAVASDSQKNWRIWENYMLVSVKLDEWDDVLLACKQLVHIKRDKVGEGSIDLPIVEKLVELLVSTDYREDTKQQNHFQRTCIEFVCVTLPSVITTSARLWSLVARVELWRRKPWSSLESHERSFRAISHNPDLEIDEKIWNETVEACEDLIAAYESLGEMEGRHGESSLVCRDWKYKARSTIKSLMSRGKGRWEDSDGWERLMEARRQL
ncbi:hypothetical protein KAFR_0C01770 [Kazachstania africana CBS 2517]|uniref:Uncharacterized protein n=1 Tax=Kazachstania africana (strain ATCC 22294 / BCRC 22015 / CBS 2517 / CECT 1963 / NBRC 1671 / NRRL Y-8276) TaxID=1071382 RepID=H2AS20_KAZAF|nr:hypothetical protein KAFR_0C01770 [Kazachstania africana CBS 2517]CCF57170.1 hypothetical protein KAFR_0C01770 [Kazachstania africana CBS 2517]